LEELLLILRTRPAVEHTYEIMSAAYNVIHWSLWTLELFLLLLRGMKR
jgi:hypothetical protein